MTLTLESRSHKMLPSTIHIMWPLHLKLWSCYVQWFRRRFIYKKILYLTFGYLTLTPRSRSHEVLPSTLNIMWPMHRQNLKLLLPKHYEEMRFQENTLFDLWPWPWGQGHTKCRSVPLTSCDLCTGKIWSCCFEKFMRCIYKKIHYLIFDLDLGVKVTQNVTQYPLHHVIYAPTKFEVATSNSLGEDTITRNVTDGQTDRRTDGRTTDRLWYEINIPYFSYEKAGITNKAWYFMRIVCWQTILM